MSFLRFFRKKAESIPTKEVDTEVVNTLKLDKEYNQFTSIERFDGDKYVEDMFLELFNAIKSDEWEKSMDYSCLKFKKESVVLKVDFSTWDKFVIKSINIETGYKTFRFNSELPIEIYTFFYDFYCKATNDINEKLKSDADKSMKVIRDCIGKTELRDSKLDILLGK